MVFGDDQNWRGELKYTVVFYLVLALLIHNKQKEEDPEERGKKSASCVSIAGLLRDGFTHKGGIRSIRS